MTDDWKATLRATGFQPYGDFGGMRARMEDIEFDAIPHPLNGLSITVTHISPRTFTNYEVFIPLDSDTQTVARLMLDTYEKIHPRGKRNQ